MKIRARPQWQFMIGQDQEIDPLLLDLLRSIHEQGRLTKAASEAGISYRHAWNLLKKWGDLLGEPLVVQAQGKGSSLTSLGEALVKAQQLIEARFTPQIESLASEINSELNKVLRIDEHSLRINASHGYAISLIPELLQEISSAQIDIRYSGSLAAMQSLAEERCDLVGFHVPQEPLLAEHFSRIYRPYLNPKHHVLVRLVTRTQGFIVAPGNPLSLHKLSDLTQPGIRFINRQKAAGTRVLLDTLLDLAELNPNQIVGYDNEEYTHAAVAAYIASGMADVGMGVEAAAQKFELTFTPLVKEKYLLACDKSLLKTSEFQDVLTVIQGRKFQLAVNQLPGYALDAPGEVLAVEDLLSFT